MVCVDCGKPLGHEDGPCRCKECQIKYRLKHQQMAYEKRKERNERKEKNAAVVIDGHPQICRYTKSCRYGSKDGCSYILAEGKSRVKQGLFIRDGKCDAYKRGSTIRCELTVVSYPKEQHPHNFMEV